MKTILDECGLYVSVVDGIVTHFSKRDGGFSIEEKSGKFLLIDLGEYGEKRQEGELYDTLDEAFSVGATWT
jgi:hypothetical protein